MSKTRKQSPKRASKSLPVKIKFKLGGRKSTKSALNLSNEELVEAYHNPTRKRDRATLLQVMNHRKVSL